MDLRLEADREKMMAMSQSERVTQLHDWLSANPEYRPQLQEAYDNWHFPTKHMVLNRIQQQLPGVTEAEVEILMETFGQLEATTLPQRPKNVTE